MEEVESRDHESSTSVKGGGEIEEESLRNDVYTAAAYGDMEKLQRLVESEGCSVSEPDSLGYYPLQWAALNNRTAAAQYIIEVNNLLLLVFFCLFFFFFLVGVILIKNVVLTLFSYLCLCVINMLIFIAMVALFKAIQS